DNSSSSSSSRAIASTGGSPGSTAPPNSVHVFGYGMVGLSSRSCSSSWPSGVTSIAETTSRMPTLLVASVVDFALVPPLAVDSAAVGFVELTNHHPVDFDVHPRRQANERRPPLRDRLIGQHRQHTIMKMDVILRGRQHRPVIPQRRAAMHRRV